MKKALAIMETTHSTFKKQEQLVHTHTMTAANKNRNIRFFNHDDISIIREWWAYQRKDTFFPELLPTTKSGIVIEGEVMEAVGFLYFTNSPRCFADFCVVNPSLSKKKRDEAINLLMDSLIGIAAGQGFKIMEITVRNNSLIKRCKAKGFVELGEVKYMARKLCPVS